jgi:RNA recognition motif-containing protein
MNQVAIIIAAIGGFVIGLIVGLVRKTSKGKTQRSDSGKTKTESPDGAKVRNIYVGNLSPEVTEKDLKDTFEVFGTVATATLIKDKARGGHKRFAFVEMPNAKEADAAISALDGRDLKGRTLKVKEAHNKGEGRTSNRPRNFPSRSRRNYANS